jgi:hypothetical protein
MDTVVFDGIARELGTVSTRRNFFRFLGGAAAVGAGLAVSGDGLAKGKSRGNQGVTAQGRGGKKVTICYQGQTRTVKKSKLGNYPGATRGACPVVGNTGGNGGGTQQPVVCTRWIVSGGPNQSDKIVVDDDIGIYNLSQGGAGILDEFNRKASWISPPVFDAKIGDKINIVGYDGGGCRSLSPIWLHCLATGQKRQVFAGYSGANCNYGTGTFVNENFEVWV